MGGFPFSFLHGGGSNFGGWRGRCQLPQFFLFSLQPCVSLTKGGKIYEIIVCILLFILRPQSVLPQSFSRCGKGKRKENCRVSLGIHKRKRYSRNLCHLPTISRKSQNHRRIRIRVDSENRLRFFFSSTLISPSLKNGRRRLFFSSGDHFWKRRETEGGVITNN